MFKIQNVFERDVQHNLTHDYTYPGMLLNCADRYIIATEKLDGTNVRLTVRGWPDSCLVRIEKRRNPTKLQKQINIIEPWYVDVNENDPADQYIIDAAKNTDVRGWYDGEHSCEAIGPKIANNPLGLDSRRCVPLFLPETHLLPIYEERKGGVTGRIPTDYEGLKNYLRDLESLYSPGHLAEGIVFHAIRMSNNDQAAYAYYAKIRRRDFDYG